MPHFKNCIVAIDGVHVQATIPPGDQVPYIGRKGTPTQTVMAVCNFDMQFIFACAGWEGTTHDTTIFLSVLRNGALNFPKPPNGKYYLVDVGYQQMSDYLGPYKGGRSVIERTFGVWKKRWNILRDMPSYPFKKQVKIIIATMTLQNYIRRHARRDNHFDNMKDDLDDDTDSDEEQEEYHITEGPRAQEI
ncbi:unnamed protein product [Malus baccata var. baccata]